MKKTLSLLFALLCMFAIHAQDVQNAIRWDFQDGLQGWTPNSSVKNVHTEDGVLKATTRGADPFFLSPQVAFKPSFRHGVRIRLKSSRSTTGQLFFAPTTEGPYNGFSEANSLRFKFFGGQGWQDIVLHPFWNQFPEIVRLRLDIDGETDIDIDSIEITASEDTEISTKTTWAFQDNTNPKWTVGPDGTLLSPLLRVNFFKTPFIVVTASCDREARVVGTIRSEIKGLNKANERLFVGDGKPHRYLFMAGGSANWKDELSQFSIRIVPEFEAPYTIHSIEFTATPPQEPDFQVIYFGNQEFPNRVGKPCNILLLVQNGSAEAVDYTLKPIAKSPAGLRFLSDGKPFTEKKLHIEGMERAVVRFDVVSNSAATVQMDAQFIVDGKTIHTASSRPFEITPVPTAHAGETYVPQPKPAETDYMIGTYYFPGYGKNCFYRDGTLKEWPMLVSSNLWTKPALGYYDESLPEVVDWQIKWATEHGIGFFLVDWYWDAGNLYLEHWIDAFQKAKHRKYLKWAVMWANHNPPGSHSKEDWITVTKHWIAKYLKTPEYLQLNGKPVIFIWTTEGLRKDVGGSENVAELFTISDKMAKEAGLPGLEFYAMNSTDFNTLKKEGYVGQSTYHWWSDAPSTSRDNMFFPFKAVVDRAEAAWNEREKQSEASGFPFIPVAETGWDGRPRHSLNTYIIYERTPAEFKRHLQSMKQWLDKRDRKLFILAPWNEWTEGSFIEPCSDFGFGMLRAIRDVFCKNITSESDDTCPADLDFRSYDQFPVIQPIKRVSDRTEWDFRAERSLLDWVAAPIANQQFTADGCSFVTQNGDPITASPKLKINAADFDRLEVVLSVSPSDNPKQIDNVEVFWATPFASWNANASLSLPLVADGRPHLYVFPLATHPQWVGVITGLRVDPCGESKRTVIIQHFKLLKTNK